MLVVAHRSGVVELGFIAFAFISVYVHPPGLFLGFKDDFLKTEYTFLRPLILAWHISLLTVTDNLNPGGYSYHW